MFAKITNGKITGISNFKFSLEEGEIEIKGDYKNVQFLIYDEKTKQITENTTEMAKNEDIEKYKTIQEKIIAKNDELGTYGTTINETLLKNKIKIEIDLLKKERNILLGEIIKKYGNSIIFNL